MTETRIHAGQRCRSNRTRPLRNRATLYAFDLDGTLAQPIVADPACVKIPEHIRKMLIGSSRMASVAIIMFPVADTRRYLASAPIF